jgi:hypothetical protein
VVGRNMYEISEVTSCVRNLLLPSDLKPSTYIAKKAPEDRGGSAFYYSRSCSCQIACFCRPRLWVYCTEK